MASKSSDQEIPCPEPPPPPVPTTTVKFSDASGKPLTGPTIDLAASKVYVSVMDDNHKGSGNIDNAVTVTLTRNGSVVKTTKVSVTETATKGTFLSDAITLGLADSGAMFEIAASDILKAEYVDPDDSSRINSDTKKVWALLASAFDCAGVQANINSGGKTTFKVLGIGIVNTQVMVYDITGKQVWRGSKASDTLEWNGMSANGARLANGVYLYVAICKGEKQSDIKTLGVKKLGILK
ncbi:gliding motility-associated C-terminal domain-containing protein [Candidatus Acetothermia bacterium]|nr:gliding motility-associated C-terminal domain-containing protein [Candidatus Acetothermia bacterium]